MAQPKSPSAGTACGKPLLSWAQMISTLKFSTVINRKTQMKSGCTKNCQTVVFAGP